MSTSHSPHGPRSQWTTRTSAHRSASQWHYPLHSANTSQWSQWKGSEVDVRWRCGGARVSGLIDGHTVSKPSRPSSS